MPKLPTTAGVPESVPSLPRVRPAGIVELLENVVVPMPPLWVNCWLNGVPAVATVVDGLVTVIVWQLMVRLYVAPLPEQPLASVAVTTIGELPLWVDCWVKRGA